MTAPASGWMASAMRSDFKEGRRGLAFKNGKLYEFTDRHVLVVSGGRDPRAWFKRRSHGWKATRKWADLLFSSRVFPDEPYANLGVAPVEIPIEADPGQLGLDANAAKELALRAWRHRVREREGKVIADFVATIPADVRSEVMRYRVRQWHVYNVLARCPGALDLSRSNPALLFALASNWVFHKPAVCRPLRAVRSLVNKKQKVILEWLGFPATETARRIMAKITPSALSPASLFFIRRALEQPDMACTLARLEHINRGVLDVLMNRKLQSYLTPRFLMDLSRVAPQDEGRLIGNLRATLGDTVRMAEQDQWRHSPRQFSTLKRLQEVHDDLTRRVTRQDWLKRRDWIELRYGSSQFPPPPFAGTRQIRPIDTPAALYYEGGIMQHCVWSHVESVFEGREYVYRVLAPVRATVSITQAGKGWVLGELSLQKNKQADRATASEVCDALFKSGCFRGEPVDNSDLPEWVTRNQLPDEQLGPLRRLVREKQAAIDKCMEMFGGKIIEIRG